MAPRYKMIRVPEEEFARLREAQQLLRKKGLESVDWASLGTQKFVKPPDGEPAADDRDAAVTLGFVIGAGAAALALLIARRLEEQEAAD